MPSKRNLFGCLMAVYLMADSRHSAVWKWMTTRFLINSNSIEFNSIGMFAHIYRISLYPRDILEWNFIATTWISELN